MKLNNSILGRLLIVVSIILAVLIIPSLAGRIPVVVELATRIWPYAMRGHEFIVIYGIGVLAIMLPLITLLIASMILWYILKGE